MNGFTINIAAIIPDNYMKFFKKMNKKLWTRDQLKKMILSKYHDYLNV
jgi:hypothetical protein